MQIPIPVRSYIKVEKVRRVDTIEYEASLGAIYLSGGAKFTMKKNASLTLDLKGEQFPVYVCLKLEKEMPSPIFALVTEFNKNGEALGSQVHFVDDTHKCFTTNSVWSGLEKSLTRIELMGDATDNEDKAPLDDITVTLEVNSGQIFLRPLIKFKWLLLGTTLALLLSRTAIRKSAYIKLEDFSLLINIILVVYCRFILNSQM